jgi:hypothetical protein
MPAALGQDREFSGASRNISPGLQSIDDWLVKEHYSMSPEPSEEAANQFAQFGTCL